MTFRSSAPEKADPRRRSLVARLAGLGAAGVLATFVAAPAAMADDSSAPADTSSDTAPSSDAGTDTSVPSDTPTTDTPSSSDTSSDAPTPSDTGSSSSSGSSDAPGGSAPGGSGGTTKQRTPNVKTQLAPAITPNYGVQKIRVQIALDENDTFAPDTSLANSVIVANETGPNAPGGDPAVCVTDEDGFCAFDGPEGYYVAGAGDTVTFTQITQPDGPGVLTDVPQVVGPCVIPEIILEAAIKAGDVISDAPPPDCGITSDILNTDEVRPSIVDHNFFDTAVTFVDPAAPPVAVDDNAAVHTGDSVDVQVLANDIVYGLPATLVSVTQPAHGHAVKIGSHVSYTPDVGYGGPDTFTYTMSTANGSDTATVHINVIAPPIARDDSAATTAGDPGASIVIPVLANDSANGGAPLVMSFATNAAHGTIEFSGTDSVRYTPRGNFVGVDSFQYTITTPNGSDTATVTVTITAPLGVGGLANTGVQPEQLGTIAALLLLAGGWVTYSGRRNRVRRAH